MGGQNDVIINATVGDGSVFTRTNPAGTVEEQKVFNDDDAIVIKNSLGSSTYAKSGDSWEPSDGGFLKWETESPSFYAYYPAEPNNTFEQGKIFMDQSTLEGLAKSDFMTAEAHLTEIPTDRTLSLAMKRQTARVIFKGQLAEGFEDAKEAKIETINAYSLLDAPALDNSTRGQITSYRNVGNNGDISFVALVSPSEGEENENFAKVTVSYLNDNSVEQSRDLYVKGIPAMEAGKSYTYNLKIGKDQVKIGGVTVEDWGNSAIIEGGEASTKMGLVKQSIADQLASGKTIEVTLPSDAGKEYFTAIKEVLGGQANGSIDLTLKGVETIGSQYFYESQFLKSVSLPDTKTIGSWAFGCCDNLEEVNIPQVTSIADYAFFSCDKLAKLTAPAVTSIGEHSFFYCAFSEINLPSLTSIGRYAFSTCSKLATFNAPKVNTIGYKIFEGCYALKTVILGNIVKADCVTLYTSGHPEMTVTFGPFGGVTTEDIDLVLSKEQKVLETRNYYPDDLYDGPNEYSWEPSYSSGNYFETSGPESGYFLGNKFNSITSHD